MLCLSLFSITTGIAGKSLLASNAAISQRMNSVYVFSVAVSVCVICNKSILDEGPTQVYQVQEIQSAEYKHWQQEYIGWDYV
jgi:hypothetical protein